MVRSGRTTDVVLYAKRGGTLWLTRGSSICCLVIVLLCFLWTLYICEVCIQVYEDGSQVYSVCGGCTFVKVCIQVYEDGSEVYSGSGGVLPSV